MRAWMAGLLALVAMALVPAAARADSAGTGTVRAQRADYWEDASGRYLWIQGYTSEAAIANDAYSGPALVASWYDADGNQLGSGALQAQLDTAADPPRYEDHGTQYRLGARGDGGMPATVRISAPNGDFDTLAVRRWASGSSGTSPGFLDDFNTGYVDPQESNQRISGLAAQFPDLAQVYALPYKSAGYQRKAQTVLGIGSPYTGSTVTPSATDQARAVVLTSIAWGQNGGNDITAQLVDPGASNAPLTVSVSGNAITVRLATDAVGAITSTAAQVVSAINADSAAAARVTAGRFRANAGAGLVVPQTTASHLSDWLQAPASYPRGPQTVHMLRIGSHRDGSRLGVFMYCQERGDEWMTPLVCLETAERLLRNYATDPETKALLDGLDIFIIPTVNPDGAAYSMYDSATQARNMVDACASDPTGANDPYGRNSWGVDISSNSSVGSLPDGYLGASGSCTADAFSGPFELSEPETRNEQWVESSFPNVGFALNVSSSDGFVTWPPGAEKPDGTPLPYPGSAARGYLGRTAAAIADRIQAYRGTTIPPQQTGVKVDALGSRAGNSADEAYYDHGIVALDLAMGMPRAQPRGHTVVGVQPCFGAVGTGGPAGSCPSNGALVNEGHDEGMEFADGAYALLHAALDYADDATAPSSDATGDAVSRVAQRVSFGTSEPASVFYTTDGSTPTTSSSEWKPARPDQLPDPLTIASNTTLRWIAVDVKGNQSAMQSKAFVIDAVAPTVSFTHPDADDASFAVGQPVVLSFTCADEPGGSGVESCTGSTADGARLDTSRAGTFAYSVTARDAAGNERTVTRHYTVKPAPVVTPTPTPTASPTPPPSPTPTASATPTPSPTATPTPSPPHHVKKPRTLTAHLHGRTVTYRLRRHAKVRAKLERRRGHRWHVFRTRRLPARVGTHRFELPRRTGRVVLTAGHQKIVLTVRRRHRR